QENEGSRLSSTERAPSGTSAVGLRAIYRLDQPGDVGQREAKRLRPLDEHEPLQHPLAIAPMAARGALGFREQPLALIEAQGLHVDARRLRELAAADPRLAHSTAP